MLKTLARPAVLAAALLAATTAAAFAHAHLKTAVPAEGSTTTAKTTPLELRLTFTEGLNLAFSGVRVTHANHNIPVGKAFLKKGDDTVLIIQMERPLNAGAYKVFWHALSRDGHKTKGSYAFTVQPK